jgi:alkaline phosphatase D
MSALRPPGLGPIIGHTTHKSCRLWIQAGLLDGENGPMSEADQNRRSVGVIGVMSAPNAEQATIKQAYYFRLHREFDRTGTFALGEDVALGRHATNNVPRSQVDKPMTLTPDTEYTVRLATLSLDDPLDNDDRLSDSELRDRLPDIDKIAPLLLKLREKECQVTFRTFPAADKMQDSLAFLLGSCRYPGLLWKIKEADQIFGPMLEHLAPLKGRPAARFTLMVGDQIYADTLNRFIPIGLADTYEEFQERYQSAYGSRNMSRLLKAAPTYMILDDHEIEDNWTQDRIRKSANHRLFNLAIGAYRSYQWSHSPRSHGDYLYYDFDCGGYPFFALDTRTQRFKDDLEGLADNHMLGRPTIDPAFPGQLGNFLAWLSEQQKTLGNVPKFVIASSVFAPNAMNERITAEASAGLGILFDANRKRREDSDSWPCYPNTRRAIIEHIVANKIQNVVFLTGDIHCSNVARLSFTLGGKDARITAYDVTSSAFYWPFSFADGDPNDFVHDSTRPEQLDPFPFTNGVMNYRAWGFTQEDNFARLEIDRKKKGVMVRYFADDGAQIEVADEAGKRIKELWLPLEPW